MASLTKLEKKQKLAGNLLKFIPNFTRFPPALFRPLARHIDKLLGLAKIKMNKTEDHWVHLSTCNKKIKVRLYTPNQKTGGTLVYFHGGGCVIGDIETHDRFCRYLAHHGQMKVISVDYRLAPETKFPGPICDAIDAWNWVHKNAQYLNISTKNIGVAGDSAGAYLSALIGLPYEQKGLPVKALKRPKFQLLIYPMLDLRGDTESYSSFNSGLILTRDLMNYFTAHYLSSPEQAYQPLASPLLSEDLSNSPPTYILTVEFDPLKDSGMAYSKRLMSLGINVTHDHFDDSMHAFISVTRLSKRAENGVLAICEALKQFGKF